jgi:AcrR family transcriptional regulator
MRVRSSTPERLMTAAERLIARKGLDAVSIRDITGAARANTAAIHYHFGSKHALVEAILERRAADLGARRAVLLEKIEADPQPTLRDVVAAVVIPTAELAADTRHGGRHYVAFLAAVLAHPGYMDRLIDIYEPHTSRYMAALDRVTPHLPAAVRELRWALAKDVVNRTLGNPRGPVHGWLERHARGADDALPERLIDFLAGAFAAPAEA